MPPFILAVVILVVGYWLIKKAGKMQPGAVKPFLKKMAGGAIIGFSGLLALRGMTQAAVPLFVFGLGLIGHSTIFPNGFPFGGAKSSGQKSKVETPHLTMELDHDSGNMQGTVLQGPSKGMKLAELNEIDLKTFHKQCMNAGDQSASLLEAWLDRNRADWRETWGVGGSSAPSGGGKMSKDEAYAVLGLSRSAKEDEVRAAHRRLMKDFHPDKGGSDYLASKINEAKDVLLG